MRRPWPAVHWPSGPAGVHDDVLIRALYLEDGDTQLATVSCDLIAMCQTAIDGPHRGTTQSTGGRADVGQRPGHKERIRLKTVSDGQRSLEVCQRPLNVALPTARVADVNESGCDIVRTGIQALTNRQSPFVVRERRALIAVPPKNSIRPIVRGLLATQHR